MNPTTIYTWDTTHITCYNRDIAFVTSVYTFKNGVKCIANRGEETLIITLNGKVIQDIKYGKDYKESTHNAFLLELAHIAEGYLDSNSMTYRKLKDLQLEAL